MDEDIVFTGCEIELSVGVNFLCIEYPKYDLVKNDKIGKVVNKIGTQKSCECS